jgi:signal-transduction protein with cAMP-binding, CBS, and nucleotidyltransferase domain
MPIDIPASMIPETPTAIPKIMAALEKIVPLQGLPVEDREWLASHGQEVHAKAGDVIFEEGQPAEQLMLILKGEVHVRRIRTGPWLCSSAAAAR